MRITKKDLKKMILEVIDEGAALNLIDLGNLGLDPDIRDTYRTTGTSQMTMTDSDFIQTSPRLRRAFSKDEDFTEQEAAIVAEIEEFFLNLAAIPDVDLFDVRHDLRNDFQAIINTVDPEGLRAKYLKQQDLGSEETETEKETA